MGVTNFDKNFKNIPDTPGIYLFYNTKKELVYVGKATSLRNRVRSYFGKQRTPRPIEQMIHEVKNIKWKETDSVLEAVILEANYIKKYLPKYNVDGKDDKSWNYIVVTGDGYPRVATVRSHELDAGGGRRIKNLESRIKNANYKHIFGPYPGLNTKATMKLLRRLFYISTCKPNTKRPCLYHEMGQCLGVCTGEISPSEYKTKVIRPLIAFLKGGKKRLVTTLERRMKVEAKAENFEEAARLRNQIKALRRIHDVALLNDSFFTSHETCTTSQVVRIEGYDISNLGASGKVGSVVVFTKGEPDKKQYRKFKIKTVVGQSDVDCLDEVLTRRLKHDEWKLPDLFLIDGGKPQLNRVKKILKEKRIDIPVVGIAKGPDRKKNEFVFANQKSKIKNLKSASGLKSRERDLIHFVNQNQNLLISVRDEAHRFAVAYQRKLRGVRGGNK